jgi:hypothetical protein
VFSVKALVLRAGLHATKRCQATRPEQQHDTSACGTSLFAWISWLIKGPSDPIQLASVVQEEPVSVTLVHVVLMQCKSIARAVDVCRGAGVWWTASQF